MLAFVFGARFERRRDPVEDGEDFGLHDYTDPAALRTTCWNCCTSARSSALWTTSIGGMTGHSSPYLMSVERACSQSPRWSDVTLTRCMYSIISVAACSCSCVSKGRLASRTARAA